MKKRRLTLYTTLLILFFCSSLKSQTFINEEIESTRITVNCSSFGIGGLNNLDTYLSNYDFDGMGVNYTNEKFRDAKFGTFKWKKQTKFSAILGLTQIHSIDQYTLLGNYQVTGYHSFDVGKRLSILVGPQFESTVGTLYVPGNGNNPASIKLRAGIAASCMAIYKLPWNRTSDIILRYQADFPLLGMMFTPEYGESYYEIFSVENKVGLKPYTFVNAPSMRSVLSVDIPLFYNMKSTTIRLSYMADIYQSKINNIRTHTYFHAFTFGIVKTLYKIKPRNDIYRLSPY